MSALTDKIAAEHHSVGWRCKCGWKGFDIAEHIAEVTEAAVREQVARDLEVEMRREDGAQLATGIHHAGRTYQRAARIARGGAA